MEDQLSNRLQARLNRLRSEQTAGERMLAELEQKQRTLRDTLLRISGAVQVLEEELGQTSPASTAEINGIEGSSHA